MPTPSLSSSRAAALSRLGVWAATLVGGAAASMAIWRLVLLTVAVSMGGCAVLPGHVERPISFARSDVADTQLAKIAAASTPQDERALSGFCLLPDEPADPIGRARHRGCAGPADPCAGAVAG